MNKTPFKESFKKYMQSSREEKGCKEPCISNGRSSRFCFECANEITSPLIEAFKYQRNMDEIIKKRIESLQLTIDELQDGEIYYTPDDLEGTAGKKHNIFIFDKRISYITDFGHDPIFYKLS